MSGRDRPSVDELLAGLSALDEHVRSAGAATGAADRSRAVLAGVTRMRARRRAAARWAAGGAASVVVGLVLAAGVWRANRAAGPVDGPAPEAIAAQDGTERETPSVDANGMANASDHPDHPDHPDQATDPPALADATDATDTEVPDATAPGRIARPFALIELELVRHRLDELQARRPVIH